jgi:hypothetical protein
MYTPAVNDILELTVFCFDTTMGQLAENKSHWKVTGLTAAGATSAEIAAAMSAVFAADYKPALATEAEYYGLAAQKIFPLPRTPAGTSKAGGGIGTGTAGAALPGQVSGIIQLQTAGTGRGQRGRQYIPFPSVGVATTAGGIPTAGYVTLLDTIAGILTVPDTVVGGGGTTTITPGIFNRRTNTFTQVSGFNVPQVWATQRRRGSYGRRNVLPF